MKIAIVLGTRPEIIKMSPVIRECQKRQIDFFILHSGQHYSPNMDNIFFEELNLPLPQYNLSINKEKKYSLQISKMTKEMEKIFLKEKPDIIFVQGDTNTVLAGTLAAKNRRIKIGHIEAGLRSNDRRMLEEINRIVVDNISDFLFTPTKESFDNLEGESFDSKNIFNVGNTIVDSIKQNLGLANLKTNILKKQGLKTKKYILATSHRSENVDKKEILNEIIKGLCLVQNYLDIPLIFPIHPRTKMRIREFGITIPKEITLIEPLGFLDFLQLEKNAKLILTDSGGVQEEACILNVPCVTMRISTERPETVSVGANIVSGLKSEKILKSSKKILNNKEWDNPFGDGKTAEKILKIIQEEMV
jgi:UDP-N-acetylglucosamine 2-epimerase (non-hydrolysing)